MKVSAAVIGILVSIASSCAFAQSYPSRPVRLVITYPPGGTTDFVGRPVAQKLSEILGQQVVVDNRGGAGGVIGTMIVAQAVPDGYTILLGTSSGMLINPLLQAKLPYDAFRDFAPVSRTNINPQALVTNAALPANSVKELIAYARANPGKLNAASSGTGTPNHLGTEMLKHLAKVDIVHVPYKGGGPAMTDLIAGQVQMQFSSIPTVLTHVKAGRIKMLAIGSAKRSPALPDTPTIAEGGVPGYEYTTWYGVFAPRKTPPAIVARLNEAVTKAVLSPEVGQRLIPNGAEPSASTPDELTRYMKEESARWA
ncbi:MAG TPA: tripartite tricarboxylate transporter substrate binding protein, partial [Burkholderiales bacterium]|nr:tripartite tricarboxylate transporter substrate binding protein [Burkholderiales bacterium]